MHPEPPPTPSVPTRFACGHHSRWAHDVADREGLAVVSEAGQVDPARCSAPSDDVRGEQCTCVADMRIVEKRRRRRA